jgi:hypothetical protein
MVRDDDEEAPWTRQLVVVLAVLVVVAVVIGGVMSVVALGAAKVSGIDEVRPSASAPASLFIPEGEPTTSPQSFPDPEGDGQPDASSSASPTAKPTKKAPKISLQAFPQQVSANQRINLTGVYPQAEGAQLQVQRFEGSWVDFPVTATVRGGAYTTYIYTGRTGVNRLRVLDKASGLASRPVRVTVG